MTAVACVDVGGTRIKTAVLRDGVLLDAEVHPTPRPATPAEEVVDAIASHILTLAGRHELAAAGLVVPGLVDAAAGVGIWSENLRWSHVPLRDPVAQATGLPVAFGHDVRAGALAEARLGAGSGRGDVLFLAIGTGVAAGIVLDGIVLDRPHATGEIGHVDVGHGEPCMCGLTGCLEAIASAAAVSRRYAARTGRAATADRVAELVAAGDPDATSVWHDAVEALALAVSWVAGMLAPEIVVVGGGLARSGDLLLQPLRSRVEERLSFQHLPEIVPASLGDRAGCLGAGLLALDLLEGRR